MLIEGFFLVSDDSPIHTNAQVDQPGNTVAVGKGGAYDLFLSRELHDATIVRIPTSPAMVQAFSLSTLRGRRGGAGNSSSATRRKQAA